MSNLSIYFGPTVISLTENEGKKLLNSGAIAVASLNASTPEGEKVPEQVKLSIAIKDKLKLHSIETKNTDVVLPGKDLIIRTFHMPILAPNDLASAVRFEAKKYIPFKVEDLVSDFQVKLDKSARKYFVLFVGIKKDALEKYLLALNQLSLKIDAIEYAGFSILRLLKLAKVKEKGVIALVNIDLAEDDEVNFVVMEDGFPLFSRDITLTGEAVPEALRSAKPEGSESLEKLKVELRISLDFYLRKFPTKNIQNVVFMAPDEHRIELENFIRERGLTASFVDCRKLFDKPVSFSSSLLKSYAGSLSKTVKSQLSIDLLPGKSKKAVSGAASFSHLPFLDQLKVDPKLILLGIAIVIFPFLWSSYKKKPIVEELAQVVASRPRVASISGDSSLETLNGADADYKAKIKLLRKLMADRRYVTPSLDIVPKSVPRGLWLSAVSYQKDGAGYNFQLGGFVYLGDSNREMEAIKGFIADLKRNTEFFKQFPNISLVSFDQGQTENTILTNFKISCRSQ